MDMTNDDIHQVIAAYDRDHPRDIFAERRGRREAEEKERRQQQPRQQQAAATNQKHWDEWFGASFVNHLRAAMQRGGILCEVVAKAMSLERQNRRDEYEPKLIALEKRCKELEDKLSLDTRLAEMERALDVRQAARDEAKRGPTGRQGERGARGERGVPGARGPKGEPGLAAAQITAWKIDRQRYRAVPFYSDGKPGPAIELRDFFAQFLNEVEGNK